MNTLKELAKQIEQIKEFGDIPKYSTVAGRKYIYVFKNNGQIPTTRNLSELQRLSGWGGYATFIGRFTIEEIQEWLKELDIN